MHGVHFDDDQTMHYSHSDHLLHQIPQEKNNIENPLVESCMTRRKWRHLFSSTHRIGERRREREREKTKQVMWKLWSVCNTQVASNLRISNHLHGEKGKARARERERDRKLRKTKGEEKKTKAVAGIGMWRVNTKAYDHITNKCHYYLRRNTWRIFHRNWSDRVGYFFENLPSTSSSLVRDEGREREKS